MATDVERYRGTSQFAEIGRSFGGITRRPNRHTRRAQTLGLEPQEVHLQPRHEGSHRGLLRTIRASGERAFVKPSTPRPGVSERQQIADGWEAVEIPEILVVDFSKGVDEIVKRPDAFELNFAPAAVPEEIDVFVHGEAEKVGKRDRVYRIVSKGRDETRRFLREIRFGMDSQRVKRYPSGA